VKKSGVELIADERRRQMDELGWTPEHDKEHTAGELVRAALCYAVPSYARFSEGSTSGWPWGRLPESLQKESETKEEQVSRLAKAAALLAAEIDRLLAE
jgi:hypothetical protein